MDADGGSDTLKATSSGAGRQPLDINPGQQVAVGEHTKGLQRDPFGALHTTDTGPTERELLAAQHHRRTVSGVVEHRRAISSFATEATTDH